MNELNDKVNAMRGAKTPYADTAKSGMIGGGYAVQDGGPCKPTLLDRVSRQITEARRQSEKAERLMELGELLSKNPDVARILDLLDADILR